MTTSRKQRYLGLLGALALVSAVSVADAKGKIIIGKDNDTGMLTQEVDYFATGAKLSKADAGRALDATLDALVRRSGDLAVGFGLFGVWPVPGAGTGAVEPEIVEIVRKGPVFDVYVAVPAEATRRQITKVTVRGWDAKKMPEITEPFQLEIEWPAGALDDRGSLLVQVRLPIAAFADAKALRELDWDPALLGAALPDGEIEFLTTGDHLDLASEAGLPDTSFDAWVAGKPGTDAIVQAIADGAKIGKDDAARLLAVWSTPNPASRSTGAPAGIGVLTVASREARPGRNPQSGKGLRIAAKRVARFKAGAELAKSVNK